MVKKLLAVVVSTLLLTFGLVTQPASAACTMTGTGASNDPWIILTPADLTQVGVVDPGGCLTTYNQPLHYRLGANIALTGNFTPLILDASGTTGSFDGNNKVISGLNIARGGSNNVGLFSYVVGVTVKDFTLTGAAVAGAASVGAIAGSASYSLIQNISVVMSGNVSGTQLVGGLIGQAEASALTGLTYRSRGGAVTGTSYVGGGFGKLDGTTLANTSISSSITATNISGGVVGEFVATSSTTLNGITYAGSFVGDQYVGGLIGYLWSSSTNRVVTITNSSVIGRVVTADDFYFPRAFVGHVGAGILDTVLAKNYSIASYFSGVNEATNILAVGGPITISTSHFETWNTGTTIGGVNVALAGITAAALAGGSTWTVAQKATYSTSTGGEEWVVDTGASPMNSGKPMTKSAYNMGFFNAPCQVGTFSATGYLPCDAAPLGSYVSIAGAMEATLCPAGSFAASTGSYVCTPASAGSYVATPGSSTQQTCAAGYTSAANAITCVAIAAGGGSPAKVGPRFAAKPTIKGTVSVGKSLELSHDAAVSTSPVTYSYKWHRCAKPVVAGAEVSASSGCVAIDAATAATLALGTTDAKSFLTAQVTATSAEGAATYFASSVNSKTLKYLGLAAAAKVSGTAKVGKTLSVSKLSWVAAAPTKVSYQWYRCSSVVTAGSSVGSSCKAITGARSSSYRVGYNDKKKYLAVKVSAVLGTSKLNAAVGVTSKAS